MWGILFSFFSVVCCLSCCWSSGDIFPGAAVFFACGLVFCCICSCVVSHALLFLLAAVLPFGSSLHCVSCCRSSGDSCISAFFCCATGVSPDVVFAFFCCGSCVACPALLGRVIGFCTSLILFVGAV